MNDIHIEVYILPYDINTYSGLACTYNTRLSFYMYAYFVDTPRPSIVRFLLSNKASYQSSGQDSHRNFRVPVYELINPK